jgi:tetratricopeptide (TPR) repeat protein
MFTQTIALTVLSLVFLLNVVGQNAPTSKCADDDHECLVFELTKKINLNPKSYEYYYVRAASYTALKKYDLALQDYDKAIELNPKSDMAYAGRGYVYYSQDQYVEAVAEYKKTIKLNPANDYALESLKSCLSLIKQSSSAIDFYDKLIQMEPDNAEYYYERSKKKFALKNFVGAAADASKAIEFKPEYTDAYAVRADSYCNFGNWKDSTDDIQKYENLKGKSFGAVCYIHLPVSLKYCAGEIDEEDCKLTIYNAGIANPKLIAFPSSLGKFYAGRGLTYYERGNFERAFSDFDDAEKYSYNPKDERIEIYLGKQSFIKGKYDEALKHFISAAAVKRESAEAYLGIGEIYLIKREYKNAFENYEQAIFLNPGLSKAYLGRGTVYLEFGRNYEEFEKDESKAVVAYKKAVKDFDSVTNLDLRNTNPEAYLRRAKAFEKLGEQDKADADRAKYKELSDKP